MTTFKAILLEETDGKVSAAVRELDRDRLPAGDVLVRVRWTTLNYKDGLILKGQGRLVRQYPHVPGIDFAGEVLESDSPRYRPGDQVILTGWRVGEVHWGGYGELARVKADWLVPLPPGLTCRQAMAVGTAGLTAMLCVQALEAHGLAPGKGEVLVTGAAGGVGSVAVAVLAKLGYRVAASTGRAALADYLKGLGAAEIVPREELAAPAKGPLGKERWAGCVDTVAGAVLAGVLPQIAYGGAVAACGLAGGPKLETTVIPFLLRGVSLLGIDSVMQPYDSRVAAWARIARDLPAGRLEAVAHEHRLDELPALAGDILAGRIQGRVVVPL